MNVGIIAEYNPFHMGHKLHIEKTRQLTGSDGIIAIMSGSFVQRGEPAVADKFLRTRTALENGVDMVLELPVPYAVGSADVFAFGAVDSLNKSGIVDMLSFGTETGSLDGLREAAELLSDEPDSFKRELRQALDGGMSYAAARELAIGSSIGIDTKILSQPNSILAVEYLKALKRLNSSIKPVTVKREGGAYLSREMCGELSSASALRSRIYADDIETALTAVPDNSRERLREALKGTKPHIDLYSGILGYILLKSTPEELALTDGMAEGLENRIISLAGSDGVSALAGSDGVSALADRIKSRRYTHSRIRRILLHIILGIKKSDADTKNGVKYIRVLGFRQSRRDLLSELCKKSDVPVITNVKNAPVGLLDKELFATDMYYLPLTGERNKDFTEPITVV